MRAAPGVDHTAQFIDAQRECRVLEGLLHFAPSEEPQVPSPSKTGTVTGVSSQLHKHGNPVLIVFTSLKSAQ